MFENNENMHNELDNYTNIVAPSNRKAASSTMDLITNKKVIKYQAKSKNLNS
jgi:hypothetical protein